MATLKYLSQYFITSLNVGGGIDASQTTGIVLQSVAGVSDISKPGQICVSYSDPIDTGVAEWINYTSINGSNELVGVTRGCEGYSAHTHLQGATVAFVMSASHHNDVVNAVKKVYNETSDTLLKASSAEITTGTEDAKIVTPKGLKDAGIVANSGILTTSQYAPQGFLINGKIVPSVASNNLTVAIKGMDGNDPSASNPVYVRIGDTVRTLTAALSVTKNAGTNWFNAGATELATKEIDYFVYLGYNTTDGVVIGFGRIPSANEYGDFSTTSTNEKYCAISTTTNAVSGDDYELVGRFAATLSAGAGYTWSVPTFTNKNLIQRPIYETRFLSYVPTLTWSAGVAPSGSPGINTHTYKITYNNMHVSNFVDGYSAGTSVTRVQITTPILPSGYFVNSGQITISDTPNATTGYVASGGVMNLFCTSVAATRFTNTALFSI